VTEPVARGPTVHQNQPDHHIPDGSSNAPWPISRKKTAIKATALIIYHVLRHPRTVVVGVISGATYQRLSLCRLHQPEYRFLPPPIGLSSPETDMLTICHLTK